MDFQIIIAQLKIFYDKRAEGHSIFIYVCDNRVLECYACSLR